MKKAILTFAMIVCTAAMFAQHTLNSALKLVEGQNSYQLETGKKPPVIWKYHAGSNSGAILKISDYGNASLLFLKPDSSSVYGYYDYSKGIQYYPVGADEDLYVSLNSFTGQTEFNFNAAIESNNAIGHGYSQDDAVSLTEGKNYMFASKSSGSTIAYLTYTATEDGVLEISTTSYISSATYSVDGTSANLSFQSNNNQYVAKLTVSKGKTYSLNISSYSTYILSAKLTHPTIGTSYDLPFSAAMGSNTLPADAGTYWYSLNSTDKGFFSMASSAALENGSVKVYAGTYSSYSSPIATLTATLNGKWESSSYYDNYLIKIEKAVASTSDESFTLAYEPYAKGTTESNPYSVETLPATLSTGNGSDYYYAVEATESNIGKFLKAEAASNISNSSTQVYVYKSGSYSKSQGNKSAQTLIESSGQYIIHWYNKENAPVDFTVSIADPLPGDTYDNPAPAQKGSNSFNGTGTRFYSYTATLNGKLTITPSSSSIYLSVPKSATGYDTWQTSKDGSAYTLSTTKGTTYILKFTYVKDGDSFTLDESTYAEGESSTNPITVTESPYNLTPGKVSVWLKYVAPKSGVFVMKGNLDYNYNNSIGFIKPGESSVTTISQSKTVNGQYISFYEGSVKVKQGTEIIMNIKVPNAKEGDNIEFSVRDYNAGEDFSAPIVMEKDKEYTIPSTYSIPQWCKFNLKEGELSLYSTISFSGYLYKGDDNAAAETNGESFYASYDSSTGKSGKVFTITEAGTYYIKLTSTYSDGVFTASGSAMDKQPTEDTGATMRKNATPLEEGLTTHNFPGYVEGETQPVFYSYTAPETMPKLISIVPGTATKAEYLTPDSVKIASDNGYMAIDKGETIYVKVVARDKTLSFTTTITDYPEYGKGETEGDAINMKNEGKYFFAASGNERNVYLKYSATEDGILKITTSYYTSGTCKSGDAEAAAISFATITGGEYLATINVTKGTTYSFTLKAKTALLVSSDLSVEAPGSSYTNPITAVVGENTVPKEKGDYWYAFNNPKEGNIVITSENSLPGGNVEVYRTEYQASHGSQLADASSAVGSYNVKCKADFKDIYYIRVHKVADSNEDDVFTISSEDYDKGQFEEDPIVITSFPYEATVPAGYIYYAIDTPEDDNYTATFNTDETLNNSYTYLFVYKANEKNPSKTTIRNSGEMIFEKGCRYILYFINKEEKELKYNINFNKCEQGDDYTNPLAASSGENTFAKAGKLFYSYTATKTGKMTVYVSAKNIEVSFPLGAKKNDGSRKYVKDNLTYTIDEVKGETYIISFNNVKAGDTFEISERDYKQGEDKSSAIEITDTYTFDTENSEVWLRYNCQKAGMLTATSDLAYNGMISFYLIKNNEDPIEMSLQRKVGTQQITEYQGRVALEAGDIAYIHVAADKTYPGKTVSVNLRDVKTGETLDKPIVLNPGEKVTVPVVSESMPIWCMFTSKVGTFSISANDGINGYYYTSYEKAKANESKRFFYAEADNDFTFDCTADEAGVNYLKLVKSTAMQRIQISGAVETGITSVNANDAQVGVCKGGMMLSGENSRIRVYAVSGTRIMDENVSGTQLLSLPAGIYVVEINGKTQKVTVR